MFPKPIIEWSQVQVRDRLADEVAERQAAAPPQRLEQVIVSESGRVDGVQTRRGRAVARRDRGVEHIERAVDQPVTEGALQRLW